MRMPVAVALVLTCFSARSAACQEATRAVLGVTLTQSFGSSMAAHPESCAVPCRISDVLAPLSLSTLEIEIEIPIESHAHAGLDYSVRFVPIALMRNNPTAAAIRTAGGWTLSSSTAREATLGLGVKPAGLRGWVGADTARLEVDVSAGVFWFGSPLLAANATRLNFVFELGVGAWLSRALGVGYRHHHLSNAGLGEVNPGLNSHVLYLSVRPSVAAR